MGFSSVSEKEGVRGTRQFTCCPEALGSCEMSLFSLEESGQDTVAPVGESPTRFPHPTPRSLGTLVHRSG